MASELATAVAELKSMRTELADLKAKAGTRASGASATPEKIFSTPRDHVEEGKRGFKSHKEYFLKVMDFYKNGKLDKRLEGLQVKAAGSDEQQGLNDQYGGFLVPITFSPDLLKVEPEDDPVASKTTKIPMATPIVKIPARTDKNHSTSVAGGVTVSRRPETVSITSSLMSMEQVVLEAHGLFGLSYATEEILQDSPQSFAAILAAGFKDQFTYHLFDERLNGTGVGQFLGVMNSPALVSVTKEAGQAGATVVYENILKMRSRCWGYPKAIWLANHDTAPQLMLLNQSVGLGGAIVWQPSAREDRPDMLLGRPLYFTEYCKTLGTAGDIVLGNWSEYLEGTYQPMQQDESIHVRFVNHERAFKFWLRNAGQCWWRSALTPKNSTNTLSPFVALATRS